MEHTDGSLPHCGDYRFAPNETDYIYSPDWYSQEQEYEIVCASCGHLEEGLLPLQPQTNSRSKMIHEIIMPPVEEKWAVKMWLPVSIVVFALTVYGWRKRR